MLAFAAAEAAFAAVKTLYQGVDARETEAAAGAGAATTSTAPPTASLDDAKNALMALITASGNNDRAKANEIIAKHAGKVMAIKDVPADKLGGIVADARTATEALKSKTTAPVTADDL